MLKVLEPPLPVRGAREADAGAIAAVLKEAAGRATAHVISSHRQLDDIAQKAEKSLTGRGLDGDHQNGARLAYIPAGPGKQYARSTASRVITTKILLERQQGTWCLVAAERCKIFSEDKAHYRLELPREAIKTILQSALANISPRDASKGSFEKLDLGGFIHEVSQVILPEAPSHHEKLNAVAVVDRLIAAGYSRSKP